MQLVQDTPLETWGNHHVLAKLLAGHHFEDHLQLAMQLAVLWKFGGVLLQPGMTLSPVQVKDMTAASQYNSDSVGSCPGSLGQDTAIIAADPKQMGGLWAAYATRQAPWVETMINSFLNQFRWSQPIRDRYNASAWPIFCSPQELTASSLVTVRTLTSVSCPHYSGYVDGHAGPDQYFATLSYDERRKFLVNKLHNYGMNLGDETQGLAGIQALPRLDAFVERDRLDLDMLKLTDSSLPPINVTEGPDNNGGRRVKLFFNAWWDTPDMTWPPPPYLDPNVWWCRSLRLPRWRDA